MKAPILPIPFDFEDKTYLVGARTIDHELAFGVWLETEALRVVQRHERHLSPAEYAASLTGWRQECAAGVYEFGGALAVQKQFSAAGWKQLVFSAMAENNPGVDMHLVDRIYADDPSALRLSEIMGRLNNPNPKPPEPPAAETPSPSTTSSGS